MCPVVSQVFCQTEVRGSCCNLVAIAVLFSLCIGFHFSVATCPLTCLCASDVISCSSCNLSALPFELPGYATRLDLSHNALTVLPVDWISGSFERLVTLGLSRNSISVIDANAFAMMPHLLHLDLSSNQLTALNTSIFTGLKELKELLLFGNQIRQINPGAFSELYSLQKLYLSVNRLVTFPLGLYWEKAGPRNLTFLDLSNNRLSKVPVQILLSLTQKSGIYLQENPLICDCALLALLEYWAWKQYHPLVDFREQYPCGDDSGPSSECSHPVMSDIPLEAETYQVEPGKWLRVPCPGSHGTNNSLVFWVTPVTVVNSSTNDPHSHLGVFPNGTLEIQSAQLKDSGMYGCVTARRHQYNPNQFVEVRVVVGNISATSARGFVHRSNGEHFNTAFTTLASCVVSIILVLLYLYLTPCRCRENQGSRGCGGRALILCSDPRDVEAGQRRSNGKKVAFLEPQTEGSGNSIPKTPVYMGHIVTEGILKNGSRAVGQPLTDPAHVA